VTVRPVPALSVDPVNVTFPVFETVPLVERSVVVFRAGRDMAALSRAQLPISPGHLASKLAGVET
jgi:hypothetical protein